MQDREYSSNMYVMRCFAITMLIHCIAFVLNVLDIFIIKMSIMSSSLVLSLILYFLTYFVGKKMSFSNPKTKYFIFFGMVATFTVIGSFLTYHVVIVCVLPTLCATIYASKKFIWYSYVLMVISNIIVVYGGYYWGLADANMALQTIGTIADHSANGQFLLSTINENPAVSLFLFFVLPYRRCLCCNMHQYLLYFKRNSRKSKTGVRA